MTLIELMIGITIGLLVILAAVGTLIISRGASGAVSDISTLQQQGSYAMRVIGQQVRQAGAVDVVAQAPGNRLYAFSATLATLSPSGMAVQGEDGAGSSFDSLSVASAPAALTTATGAEWQRDCLGNGIKSGEAMDATFSVGSMSGLRCKSGSNPPQPIITNVADFQVTYQIGGALGAQRLTATEVEAAGLWGAVRAIEVCLDLQGNEAIPDAAIPYSNCKDQSVSRGNRNHLVFRNLYNLRAQVLP